MMSGRSSEGHSHARLAVVGGAGERGDRRAFIGFHGNLILVCDFPAASSAA